MNKLAIGVDSDSIPKLVYTYQYDEKVDVAVLNIINDCAENRFEGGIKYSE